MNFLEMIKEQDKILIIVGDHGAGKSLLAAQLAGSATPVMFDFTIEEVVTTKGFTIWNHDAPSFVEISGCPEEDQLDSLLAMSDNGLVRRNRMHEKVDEVPTPQFIINCHRLEESIRDHPRTYVLELDT